MVRRATPTEIPSLQITLCAFLGRLVIISYVHVRLRGRYGDIMTCPSCGLENPPSAQYCDCGHEFVPGSKPKASAPQSQGRCCPKCKAFNPLTNRFCETCGGLMQKKKSPAVFGCLGCLGLIGFVVWLGVLGNSIRKKDTSAVSSPLPSPPSLPSSSSPSASTVPQH